MLGHKKQFSPQNKKDWLPQLHELVLQMQMDEIPNVEVLCISVAGDELAGIVLFDLLEMLPRSIRADGAIWQSDKYWKVCRGISYFHMQQVRNKLSPVMKVWKENAQGAPTFHYKLNEDGLLQAVSGVFKRPSSYIRIMVVCEFEKGAAQKTENRKSITLDSVLDSDSRINQQSKTVTEIEFALIGEGVHSKTAAEFAAMNPQTVQRVIETVRAMDAAGKIRKNKAAVLVTALRREVTPPPSRIRVPEFKEGEKNKTADQDEYVGSAGLPDTVKVNPLDAMEAQVDEQHRKIWNTAKEQLSWQLDKGTFNTWLADARLIGVEQNVFLFAVRNQYVLDVCRGRLYKTVRRLLRDASGFEADVRFETVAVN